MHSGRIDRITSNSWLPAPDKLTIKSNEAHVWRADLQRSAKEMSSFTEMLSSDEQQRAQRFHFRKDRERFSTTRGILRIILSGYIDVSPEQIELSYNRFGKPELSESITSDGLQFNLSHSGGIALFAFCPDHRIGVDVESIRSGDTHLKVPERYFSPQEVTALRSLPEKQQREAFYACWTRKEAYIKARGLGIPSSLKGFTVNLEPGKPARLLESKSEPSDLNRWTLKDIDVGTGYKAAVAIECSDIKIDYMNWI
ncbi:4'-phosphopantetheinyl transferase superfamily protein [bacterium]|nr:4'-phosphopantetheinyl transferase superfamily protein [bacterium]